MTIKPKSNAKDIVVLGLNINTLAWAYMPKGVVLVKGDFHNVLEYLNTFPIHHVNLLYKKKSKITLLGKSTTSLLLFKLKQKSTNKWVLYDRKTAKIVASWKRLPHSYIRDLSQFNLKEENVN